jgi:hypothetical protein
MKGIKYKLAVLRNKVSDSKNFASKHKETGGQEKPDYQGPRTCKHLIAIGNYWGTTA